MNDSTLARTIADLARPLAASLGLELWGVEAPGGGMGGKRAVIRIFVESADGVAVDSCAELSRLMGLTLDVEDLIPGAYVLEVSSPGLERTFFTPEQLAAGLGTRVAITLHTPASAYPGRRNILGILTDASGGVFSVVPLDVPRKVPASPETAPAPAVFAWDNVKKAKRAYFPPETPGPMKGKKPKNTSSQKENEPGGGEKRKSA